MNNLRALTWTEYLDEIELMYSNILSNFSIQDPFTICGIARGGLIPLTILASRFKKKMVEVISIDSYNESTKKLEDLNFHFSSLNPARLENRILLIDDLIDSGKTIKTVWEHIKTIKHGECEVTTSVMFINNDINIPKERLIYNEVKDPSTWIQFPYEV